MWLGGEIESCSLDHNPIGMLVNQKKKGNGNPEVTNSSAVGAI